MNIKPIPKPIIKQYVNASQIELSVDNIDKSNIEIALNVNPKGKNIFQPLG